MLHCFQTDVHPHSFDLSPCVAPSQVVVTRASDESDISQYVAYWGPAPNVLCQPVGSVGYHGILENCHVNGEYDHEP